MNQPRGGAYRQRHRAVGARCATDPRPGLTLKYLIETHVHADHITAVARLKAAFQHAKSVYNAYAGVDAPTAGEGR